jgi:hypothetical protein
MTAERKHLKRRLEDRNDPDGCQYRFDKLEDAYLKKVKEMETKIKMLEKAESE